MLQCTSLTVKNLRTVCCQSLSPLDLYLSMLYNYVLMSPCNRLASNTDTNFCLSSFDMEIEVEGSVGNDTKSETIILVIMGPLRTICPLYILNTISLV